VASVLNLHRYRDLECLQQIAAYLTEHCSEAKLRLQLTAVGIHCMAGEPMCADCTETRLIVRTPLDFTKYCTGAAGCGQRFAAQSAAGECAAAGRAAAHAGSVR
jgi:hypothetical protein